MNKVSLLPQWCWLQVVGAEGKKESWKNLICTIKVEAFRWELEHKDLICQGHPSSGVSSVASLRGWDNLGSYHLLALAHYLWLPSFGSPPYPGDLPRTERCPGFHREAGHSPGLRVPGKALWCLLGASARGHDLVMFASSLCARLPHPGCRLWPLCLLSDKA